MITEIVKIKRQNAAKKDTANYQGDDCYGNPTTLQKDLNNPDNNYLW